MARFAVVLTEQSAEQVWVFETRSAAIAQFEKVRVANDLEFFTQEGDEDEEFYETHAFGYEGQQLFVTRVTEAT